MLIKNSLGDLFIKAHIWKYKNNVQNHYFDSEICLSRSVFLHMKFSILE